jgi:hypothetical protein
MRVCMCVCVCVMAIIENCSRAAMVIPVEIGKRMVAKVIAANNSGKPDELYMYVIIYTYGYIRI